MRLPKILYVMFSKDGQPDFTTTIKKDAEFEKKKYPGSVIGKYKYDPQNQQPR